MAAPAPASADAMTAQRFEHVAAAAGSSVTTAEVRLCALARRAAARRGHGRGQQVSGGGLDALSGAPVSPSTPKVPIPLGGRNAIRIGIRKRRGGQRRTHLCFDLPAENIRFRQ